MDAKNLKALYGECRCCLAKGHHRDMTKEYLCNGTRGVCFDVFAEYFNLFLSTESQLTTLICIKCIERLRDATNFRMMVVNSESHLLQTVAGSNRDTLFVNMPNEDTHQFTTEKKAESQIKVKLEVDIDGEADYNLDYVPEPSPERDKSPLSAEGLLLARFSKINLPKLPTRHDLHKICPKFVQHLDRLKGNPVSGRKIALNKYTNNKVKSKIRDVYIKEKVCLINNVKMILQYSNVTPFKSKIRNSLREFPCFCCRHIFDNFDKLREHFTQHRKDDVVLKILQLSRGAESLIVYADVTNLKCNICDKNLQNLNELKSHLSDIHSKKIYSEITDRIIPFRMLTGLFECQICGIDFKTFGAIERHMNVHYKNYICKECGAGYITKLRLKVHFKNMHKNVNMPCEYCGKIFLTQQKLRGHIAVVHKLVKRFKCPKCPERFPEYFKRQIHLEESHGVAPLMFTCNVCNKAYHRPYALSLHVKRNHTVKIVNAKS